MHKKHNSHHIFLFLGLLVALFIIIFGVRYFQPEYRFDEGIQVENTQGYDDGTSIKNPFSNPLPEDVPGPAMIPITDPLDPANVPGSES